MYITFGSVAAQMDGISDVFTEAVRAVTQLNVNALITLGHGMGPNSLKPLPPRIRVERWVDQEPCSKPRRWCFATAAADQSSAHSP